MTLPSVDAIAIATAVSLISEVLLLPLKIARSCPLLAASAMTRLLVVNVTVEVDWTTVVVAEPTTVVDGADTTGVLRCRVVVAGRYVSAAMRGSALSVKLRPLFCDHRSEIPDDDDVDVTVVMADGDDDHATTISLTSEVAPSLSNKLSQPLTTARWSNTAGADDAATVDCVKFTSSVDDAEE
jgi:predicted DNA-binding ribbon-helix-helix protein